jgi:glycosyltransferase involved in cell wall biosynthesis
MPSCEVLLAAYNGARYGAALLDSLLAQTSQEFGLVVRDDGSQDGTPEMLAAYAPRFEGRMRLIAGGAPTGSAKGNFSILLQESTADYVLCADIDDVWQPDKVAATLRLLAEAEAQTRAGAPIFVFTDVTPVDEALNPLAASFWRFKKIDPQISKKLSQSLVCPAMLGCASGMNRALVDMITPIPEGVTGHDWWALLVAACFGVVAFSPERTMLYRLHGDNQSSQKRVNAFDYLRARGKIATVRHGMSRRREQAAELLHRFGSSLDPADHRTISQFIDTDRQGFLRKRLSLIGGNYLYPDLPRNVAMLLAA